MKKPLSGRSGAGGLKSAKRDIPGKENPDSGSSPSDMAGASNCACEVSNGDSQSLSCDPSLMGAGDTSPKGEDAPLVDAANANVPSDGVGTGIGCSLTSSIVKSGDGDGCCGGACAPRCVNGDSLARGG